MQTAVIEFARNVCGMEHANSTEFDAGAPDRVIYKLRELKGVDELGGTMRLGAYPCLLAEGSFAREAYGAPEISERHRHRFEFNREYETVLTQGGMRIAGQTPDGVYVEICEIPNHPWFLGCQFHPEFKSRPLEPHPLFAAFIGASHQHRLSRAKAAPRVRSELFTHAD
jgi:CTP synthase